MEKYDDDIKITEGHMHILFEMSVDKTVHIINDYMSQAGYSKVALLALPYVTKSEGELLAQNINTIYCKSKLKEKAYAFGALLHNFDDSDSAEGYINQAKELIKQGFDGFKMFEGKPSLRKKLAKRLDDSIFDLFYEFCENEEIPIIFHLADPPVFWDAENIDEAFVKNGWFCDETYPKKEEFHEELEGILKKFPKLHMTVAHFSFLSDNIEYAEYLLENYKNLCFDLAPNPYEFIDFEKNHDLWRAFFIKYSDKIIYGTDSYNVEKPRYEKNILRTFLETDEFIKVDGIEVKCFNLPREVLENIYYNNFKRSIKVVRKVNKNMVLNHAKKLLDFIKNEENAIENIKKVISDFGN